MIGVTYVVIADYECLVFGKWRIGGPGEVGDGFRERGSHVVRAEIEGLGRPSIHIYTMEETRGRGEG